MDSPSATMHVDGAARGNPGPAAYAVVIALPDGSTVEEADTMGTATNNVAEYTALIRGLERAAELGLKRLAVFSDSELMVKQMNGEYRVKHPDLLPLYEEAKGLRKRFEVATLTHVRREQNKRADQIGNEALDGKPRRRGGKPVSREPESAEASAAERHHLTPHPHSRGGKGEQAPPPRNRFVGDEAEADSWAAAFREAALPPGMRSLPPAFTDDSPVREDAVACLAAAAAAWADKGRTAVSPEAIWDQLWSILEEGGVLKKKKK